MLRCFSYIGFFSNFNTFDSHTCELAASEIRIVPFLLIFSFSGVFKNFCKQRCADLALIQQQG